MLSLLPLMLECPRTFLTGNNAGLNQLFPHLAALSPFTVFEYRGTVLIDR